MKYLLLSDIHGSLPALQTVLDIYHSEHCDMLLLLGDIINYGPRNRIPEGIDPQGIVERLNQMKQDIVAVRGNCDSEVDQMLLQFPILSDYAIVCDNGRRLFLTHGHIYNPANPPQCSHDVLFYGHTHLWQLDATPNGIVCNIGSPTFPKGGKEPTFAIYDNGEITIRNLENNILKSLRL